MRIVIKVGTSTLTYGNGNINIRRIENLCKVISDLKNSGLEVILVSSGAIAMGVGKLGLKEKPQDIVIFQVLFPYFLCQSTLFSRRQEKGGHAFT